MEVTNMSPPPTSPTKGGDLCGTNVTNVAVPSGMLLLSLCGLAGNGAVLGLLDLNDITLFIFDLAVADFLFLLFMIPSALLFLLEDVSCSPIMPQVYASFLFQLSMVSYYWGLFRLTYLSIGKDMTFLCELLCGCKVPLRLSWLVWSAQYWASFALITVLPTVKFLCPSYEQEHCSAALISTYIIILLLFAAPMIISRTICFIKAKFGYQQQQLKRRVIVIFLVVLLTLFLSLCNFLQQLGYIAVSSQVGFLLTCINSTIKPFIYFFIGRCPRQCSVESLRISLQNVFKDQKENTPTNSDALMDMAV